jgi:hypothetical protein
LCFWPSIGVGDLKADSDLMLFVVVLWWLWRLREFVRVVEVVCYGGDELVMVVIGDEKVC